MGYQGTNGNQTRYSHYFDVWINSQMMYMNIDMTDNFLKMALCEWQRVPAVWNILKGTSLLCCHHAFVISLRCSRASDSTS